MAFDRGRGCDGIMSMSDVKSEWQCQLRYPNPTDYQCISIADRYYYVNLIAYSPVAECISTPSKAIGWAPALNGHEACFDTTVFDVEDKTFDLIQSHRDQLARFSDREVR